MALVEVVAGMVVALDSTRNQTIWVVVAVVLDISTAAQ
jgi:hypothetical protein